MENWYTRGILLWHDVILENWLHTRHPQASRILSLIVTKSMLNAKIIALKRLLLTHAMTINRSHQGSCLGHSKHGFKENIIVKTQAFQRIYSNFVEDQDVRRSSLCNFRQNHRLSVMRFSTPLESQIYFPTKLPNKASFRQNSADPRESAQSLKESVDSFRQNFSRICF